MKKLLPYIFLLFASANVWSQVTITESSGWLESAYAKWTPVSGADSYNVYYTGGGQTDKKIDTQLIRSYGTYFRADALGLAAGSYTLKVVPVIGATENIANAAITTSLTVKSHNREGFAFADGAIPGAYNLDGTPKSGAKIIYITAATANTVTCDVRNDKGVSVSTTGIMNIINARGKGFDKTPLIIRMIGLIKAEHITGLYGGNFIPFTGANSTDRKIENITLEGVGDDATASGYGFFTKRSNSIEIRNVGIMLFGDDGVSMEADNSHIWVHNNDFFYGAPGSDADQVKGDGSIDMKYNTSFITISFNHFWDSGKSTFAGGATEVNPIYFTYHHNWFDHSDSRHPRLCHATVHVYNNYCDANASMGLLNTEDTSAFVEANYYRNTPYPMMINMQGSNYQIWPNGEQNGGMTKAFNNKMTGPYTLIYQTTRPTDFDAYLVSSRNEQIPSSVISRTGGNTYSNFDTAPTMYAYTPDSPDDVQSIVTTYAGRIKGGDFKWTFNNSVDDGSKVINVPLKAAIVGYQSALVSIQGEAIVANQTLISPTNNNQTVMSGTAIASIVYTWGGDATSATANNLPAGINAATNITAKTITLTGIPTATGTYTIATSGTLGTPVTESGTITVNVPSTQTLSSPSNNNQSVISGTAIAPIVYTWGGDATSAAANNLPTGLSAATDTTAKTITITGTPTATGTYSIVTSGTAGTPVTGSGTITVTSSITSDQIHNFSLGTTGYESTFYSFPAGNATSTSYGPVSYNGLNLTRCLKTGSTANVTYTTSQKSTLILIFSQPAGSIKLDGILKTAVAATAPNTGSILTLDVNAGTHSITKGSTENHLFYMKTSFATLGLEENDVAQKTVLYPNPVTNQLFLSSSDSKVEKVLIYSLTGALVKTILNVTESIDVSNLKSGSYLLKVTTDKGTVTQKIIKN